MEYYGLILNRTFWILLTPNHLIGVQANGAIATESGNDLLTGFAVDIIVSSKIVRGDISNPYSYLKGKYIKANADLDLMSDEFLRTNANFRINKDDIKNVYHNPKKKWGMGYYPHDGRVYIETNDGKKRELIVLGNQSGAYVANKFLTF